MSRNRRSNPAFVPSWFKRILRRRKRAQDNESLRHAREAEGERKHHRYDWL
ncbi:MAG: hypothetical protein R3F10_03530 [Lysobacteraceae bacterium]